MRTIEFRGKEKYSKRFIYGHVAFVGNSVYIFPNPSYDSVDNYEVIPETVGQFIGEGVYKYYENDIVEYTDQYKSLNTKDKDFKGVIVYTFGEWRINGIGDWSGLTLTLNYNFKPIGNIHDK